jgi:NADPH-dependent 2,4-dienoyl-CoA reductase/sulfur reductase-like enzyme
MTAEFITTALTPEGNAVRQGAAAARNMLGQRTQYDEIPWFWSDQHEANVQYAGSAGPSRSSGPVRLWMSRA